MEIIESPNCLFCNQIETIEHVYLECPNAINIWLETENWVKSLHYPHFKISDIEEIFGEKYNNLMKHLIITSIKDVIYCKRKTGDNMQLSDVKRMLIKNLKTQNLLKNSEIVFEDEWRTFIDCPRVDPATRTSWYLL